MRKKRSTMVDPGGSPKDFGSLDALRQAIGTPSRRWTPIAMLGFPAAVDELLGWLRDPRVFDKANHPAAVESAIGDFAHSAEHELGGKVYKALEPEVRRVRAALVHVKADYAEKSSKEVAAAAVEALRRKTEQPPVL
ncbi:hypothetical protein ACIBP6_09420 [Nonomuraea terrae]|uniref:hypothetical protein n=1 Tax=Nonomuraea terrae TaxID=2530383 RepID=UPI00379410B4